MKIEDLKVQAQIDETQNFFVVHVFEIFIHFVPYTKIDSLPSVGVCA